MRARTATLVALTSALCVLGAGVLPPAAADDRRRKAQLDASIEALRDALHETSKELAAATLDLRRIETELDLARVDLTQAQARLAEARARETELTAALQAAHREEAQAQVEVDVVIVRMDQTRRLIAGIARATYQQGPMADVAVYLHAQSPEDFVTRLAYSHSAVRSENAILDRLTADKAILEAKRSALEAKRRQIADLRADAAANVGRMARLERTAIDSARRSAALVAEAKAVKARIEREKAAEVRRLAQMESEAAALQRRLAQRARAARARAGRADAAGASLGVSGFVTPVSGRISSPFGMRVHPVTGVYKLHDGTDFASSCGTPIRAAADGVVIESGYSAAWGKRLVIEHGIKRGRYLATAYNHLSGFAVRRGPVRRGEVVGYVGTTGYSTGCHLHFNLYVDGSPVDPMDSL